MSDADSNSTSDDKINQLEEIAAMNAEDSEKEENQTIQS